jgi:hypothetical protein
MVRRFLLPATVLCVLASRGPADAQRGAGGRARQPRPAATDAGTPAGQAPTDAGTPAGQAPPLSDEDADVAKQLALLEEVELLRNLDLFEGKSAESAQTADAGVAPDAGAAPDAGTEPRR